ncbi:hypothetical protein [Kitasatospora purpeofusca]|uniref:hypothetical protein n=1 Tax=Kitasatospora purpeofusca TaxID=67352 RepID=UPI0036AE26DE
MAETDGGNPSPTSEPAPVPAPAPVPVPVPAEPGPTFTIVDLGKVLVGAMTFVAALAGLILGIRAEIRASDDHGRAAAEEQRVAETRRRAAVERTYFYETDTAAVVVNSSDRVMRMRLVLPDKGVWWDDVQPAPCHQVVIPFEELLASMKVEVPSVGLGPADLTQLQLVVTDPAGLVWRRASAGGAVPAPPGEPLTGTGRIDYGEQWMADAKSSPVCTAS